MAEDFLQPVAVENFLGGGNGDVDQVVKIEPERSPLLLHHAHDAESPVIDKDAFPEGIFAREECVLDLAAEDGDLFFAGVLGAGKEGADLDVHVADGFEFGDGPDDHGGAIAIGELDVGGTK